MGDTPLNERVKIRIEELSKQLEVRANELEVAQKGIRRIEENLLGIEQLLLELDSGEVDYTDAVNRLYGASYLRRE